MGDPIINTQVDAINTTLGTIKTDLTALRPSIQRIRDAVAETYLTETIQNQAIASFSDGADDIPVRELECAITPVQIGNGLDPSPTNVRAILGFDKAHILNSKFAVSASNGRLVIPWKDGNKNYNPEMNLCSVSDEELEGGTSVHGAFFEWDKTMPFGVPFDEPEAICYFDGTEGAGTFHISIGMAYGTGWSTSKHIQFTLNVAPSNGDQLVINCGTSANNDPTNGRTWNLYAKGSTTSKDTGTTSNGTSGTNLGSTDSSDVGKTNGKINAPQRAVYGYNRWSESLLRQYLNATSASGWYAAQNPWDRPNTTAVAREGFLYGYGADVYKYFKPIKVVTVACNADNNVEDVTYDRVFLSSLEQMYCVPQFSGKEGSYWEYYKRLLGRTSPAPTYATYARLIKYALNAPTSAQSCWRRSATRTYAGNAWVVGPSGSVTTTSAYNANGCAPSVFISDEDMSVKTIDFGQTVYGGTVNVTTGVLTITHGVLDLATQNWQKQADSHWYFWPYGISNPAKGASSGNVKGDLICSCYPTITANDGYAGSAQNGVAVQTTGRLSFYDETYSTAADFKASLTGQTLVYELATPTTVQLTAAEVETLFGDNNIWSSTGNVIKLVYRKAWEIALAQGE